jgi:hypothetical protein
MVFVILLALVLLDHRDLKDLLERLVYQDLKETLVMFL